ncbi:MAG: hypothetical protein ACFE9L_12110 [Candidatus Hodarchaeota archaeon]
MRSDSKMQEVELLWKTLEKNAKELENLLLSEEKYASYLPLPRSIFHFINSYGYTIKTGYLCANYLNHYRGSVLYDSSVFETDEIKSIIQNIEALISKLINI